MNKRKQNNQPFISVLMAVHNTARFLPQAIESVLAETYSNYEFLIYDDVSTDDSPRIIEHYAARDHRIRPYWGKQKAPCLAPILKFLIRQSRGEYFTIPDSDDICLPDRMQCLVSQAIKNPSAGIVFGGHRMMDESCVKTLQVFGEPVWPFKYFFGGFVSAAASLVSRHYYDMTEGFDETLRWSADRDMCLKILEQAPFLYVKRVVYIYRRHVASRTFERPESYNALAIIREKTFQRNIPVVQHLLENASMVLSYGDYTALSYVMAYFAGDILGPRQQDPVLIARLMKQLGFTHDNYERLKHDLCLEGVKTIDLMRDRVVREIAKTEAQYVTSILQFCHKNRQRVIGKTKRILSILRNKK
jgi:glycosyltransferase involved in cell wall biosynthesis